MGRTASNAAVTGWQRVPPELHMKGIMQVKKLKKSGLFIGKPNFSDNYKEPGNPLGSYIMVVEPMEGPKDKVVYYQPLDDGFLIEGEAYILMGAVDELEEKVSDWKRTYKRVSFQFVEKNLQDYPAFGEEHA